MLQAFQVRVPGADFEVEIVLGVVGRGGLSRKCRRRLREEREGAEQ
jgi:hypothetical protein